MTMCDYLSTYLRRQASVDTFSFTVNTTRQLILGPDPLRYQVNIRGDGTSQVWIFMGRISGNPSQYIINSYNPNLVINEGNNPYGVVGEILAFMTSGTSSISVTTYSYTQYARQVIDAHVRQRISQLGPL